MVIIVKTFWSFAIEKQNKAIASDSAFERCFFVIILDKTYLHNNGKLLIHGKSGVNAIASSLKGKEELENY